MVKHVLEKIHSNHLGGESNYRMARDVLFWPGMRKAIKDLCESCDTCARYGTTAPKEPTQSLPIPTRAWDIVSQDLFSFEKEDLVTVCHFSDWIQVDKFSDTLSTTVVERTKGHFSRYGIPSIVYTDNGPQFISREYKDLSSTCNFKHTTSSYYAKGNGRAEAAVKVAKAMLKKSEDFQLALLLYRNMPPAGHTYSPAQRMLCHRTRSTLPTTDNLLNTQPSDFKVVQEDISAKRSASRAQYDKRAGLEHQPLSVWDYAYLKPPPNRRGQLWTYDQISRMEGPRSYTMVTPWSDASQSRPCETSCTSISLLQPKTQCTTTDVKGFIWVNVHEGRPRGDPRMERAPNQSLPETPRAKAHNLSVPTTSRAQAHYGPVSNTTPTTSPSKTVLASPIQRGHVSTRVTSTPIMRETRTRRVLPHPKYADCHELRKKKALDYTCQQGTGTLLNWTMHVCWERLLLLWLNFYNYLKKKKKKEGRC